MATISLSVQEARNYLLKRVDELGNSDWESLALEFLNLAIVDVVSLHNWEALQRKTTLTYTTNSDHTIDLPADCDRELIIRAVSGTKYQLDKVSPARLEELKVQAEWADPKVYCTWGYEQDTTTTAPHKQIELWPEPTDGDQIYLWNIKHIPELTSADSTVPNVPTAIWRIILQKAIVMALQYKEVTAKILELENIRLAQLIKNVKAREALHSAEMRDIRQHPVVSDWYVRRRSKL